MLADILLDRMTIPEAGEVTSLHLGDPLIFTPLVIAVAIGIVVLGFAFAHVKFLIKLSERGWWREVFSWGIGVFSILTACFGAMVDMKDVADNKFPIHFRWSGPALVISFTMQIMFIGVAYFKDRDEKKKGIAAEKIAALLERSEERRRQIGEIVNEKAQSVRKARRAKEESQKVMTVTQIAKAFQPKEQIILNAIALHRALRRLIGNSGTLRVAVFFPSLDAQSLKLFFGFDGTNHDCITTPKERHADRFKIPSVGGKCLAVHAAQNAGLHLITDTIKPTAEDKKKFEHFDHKQKSIIKSVVAFGYAETDTRPNAVIIADSDQRKAFKNDDEFRKRLEVEFQEFGNRLLFEADVLNLFALI
jgi:hypothetical protein